MKHFQRNSPYFSISRAAVFIILTLLTLNFGLSQTQPIRTVSLKIVADEEFKIKNRMTWRSDINQLVMNASKDFEKHFGIRFKIEMIDHWVSDVSQDTMLGLLNDLRKKVPHEDLILSEIRIRNCVPYQSCAPSSYG